MRLNSNTKVIGQNVYLVPYEELHVPKYHTWMKSEELRDLTASEPLTLEEEYEMQKSWREDEDNNDKIKKMPTSHFETVPAEDEYVPTSRTFFVKDSMIGDINIFIKNKDTKMGEIEIMIAEQSSRGQKLGWESVMLMLLYGIQNIGLRIYEAKISLSNVASIRMFNKLGFVEKSKSEIFQEITLEKVVTEPWKLWLQENNKYEVVPINKSDL